MKIIIGINHAEWLLVKDFIKKNHFVTLLLILFKNTINEND